MFLALRTRARTCAYAQMRRLAPPTCLRAYAFTPLLAYTEVYVRIFCVLVYVRRLAPPTCLRAYAFTPLLVYNTVYVRILSVLVYVRIYIRAVVRMSASLHLRTHARAPRALL